MIELKLDIKPRPLQRARTAVRGRYVNTYYTKKAQADMEELRISIINALNNLNSKDYQKVKQKAKTHDKISLTLLFGFSFPKSYTNKKKSELLGEAHTIRPDLDNLIKNVLDRGDGLLWKDDNSIYEINAKKIWSGEEHYIKMLIKYD